MKNKVKFLGLIFVLAAIVFSGFVRNEVFAAGNAVVTVIPQVLGPNTEARLTFSLTGATCPTGKTLFYLLQYFPDPRTTDSRFIDDGSGNAFYYTFNSGSAGQLNKYAGIFYCAPFKLSGSIDNIRSQLNLLPADQSWIAVFSGTTQAQAVPAAGKKYACEAGNKKYACSPGNKKDLSDVTAEDGDCAEDYTNPINVAEEIPADMCGCTKADYDAGKCKNGTSGTNSNNTPTTDKLYNPLPEEELTHMFLFIAKGFLGIVGIWAVIFIIVGGFRMVIAAGDEEALTKAKKTVTWAVIGVIVAALSFSIIAIVQNLINADIKQTATQTNNSTNNGN